MFDFCIPLVQFWASISRNNGRGKQKDGPKRRSIDRKAGLTFHSSLPWLRTCWSFLSPEAAAQSTLVRPRPVTDREKRRSRRSPATGRSPRIFGSSHRASSRLHPWVASRILPSSRRQPVGSRRGRAGAGAIAPGSRIAAAVFSRSNARQRQRQRQRQGAEQSSRRGMRAGSWMPPRERVAVFGLR